MTERTEPPSAPLPPVSQTQPSSSASFLGPPASPSAPPADDPGTDVGALRAKIDELQRERDHLVTLVDILQEISGAHHFSDVLQAIARKLGETFGLDRSSIFLTGDPADLRLVASYEDPSIRNLVVDLKKYPELQRAFDSGETVFIPDATTEPMLRDIRALLDMRNVRSIVVAPIRWPAAVIGAIFLRTERDATAVLGQRCALLPGRGLAHRQGTAQRAPVRRPCRATQDTSQAQRRTELHASP